MRPRPGAKSPRRNLSPCARTCTNAYIRFLHSLFATFAAFYGIKNPLTVLRLVQPFHAGRRRTCTAADGRVQPLFCRCFEYE